MASTIPEGSLFLLVSYMKVGKSTLAYPLAVSVAQGLSFLGRQTKRGGVLILALEEHPRDVEDRLREVGMKEDDPIHAHEGPLPNNEKELQAIRSFIGEKNVSLILVDSLSVFWNVKDENDNAAVVREVKPLLALARDTGAAVGLLHHDRKSGGEGGRNIRGGSALFGLVDQALMLELLPGERTNKRILKTLGRYRESPRELVIELTQEGYGAIGTREDADRKADMDRVLEALTDELMDVKKIAKEADLTEKLTRKALNTLWDEGNGNITREGRGIKNDPHTFALVRSNSFRSQYPSIGKETNRAQSGDDDGIPFQHPSRGT